MVTRKIHDLILEFQDIFDTLDAAVSLLEVERLVVTIHHIMERQARQYHTLEHVFDLAVVADPVQSLAALFHDTVYYQVDGDILPEVAALIDKYIRVVDGDIFVAEGVELAQRPFYITLRLFGFVAGQKLLPHMGLNEFLSALFAYQRLAGLVPEAILVQVAVCIEATIPFRTNAHFLQLAARLTAVNEQHHIGLTPTDIEECIKKAVIFSNNDVAGFSNSETAVFLDGTWKLMSETNLALRNGNIYSIRDYRIALQKMHNFLGQLTPKQIFHQYANTPPAVEWQNLLAQAQHNLAEVTIYLRIKLVAIAVVEALAELSGGDAPLALFMGEILEANEKSERLEDYLPPVDLSGVIDDPILRLLAFGRMGEIAFDIRHSPLSTYLYVTVGRAQIPALLAQAEAMFAGDVSPADFLRGLDKVLVTAVAHATAQSAITRRDTLLALPNKLYE